MQAVVGGGAAAAAVLIIVYLFASGSDSPDGQPVKMPPGSYSFTRLRDTVVPLLAGHVEFSGHQLRTGRWSVLPKPLDPDSDPVLTAEGVFRPTDEGERDVDGSKCIVVDLRGRVPGAAGAAAGGGGAAAPASTAELKSVFRASLIEYFREQEEGTASSAATPTDYEEAGRQYLLTNLENVFGLRVLPDARAHREEHEIVTLLEEEVFNFEWDFRVPVNCSGAGARNAGKSNDFIIFPAHEAYIRPGRPVRPKELTPTKIGGSPLPTASDFMAIFEITTTPKWVKELAPRMEQRLMVTLDRARSLQVDTAEEATAGGAPPPLGILDVVAVIGVVGVMSCQRSIPAHVKKAATPLLFEMMEAGRFVFIRRPYAGSPKPKSVAGRSGSKLASGAASTAGGGSPSASGGAAAAAGGGSP